MEKDYARCVGVNYFKEKNPNLCRNCKRYIPWSEPVEDTVTWVPPLYDETTNTCEFHDPQKQKE